MTPVERAEAEEMRLMDDKVKELAVRLEQLKKKADKQNLHADDRQRNGEKKEIVFKQKQVETIKTNLSQMLVFDISRNLFLEVKSQIIFPSSVLGERTFLILFRVQNRLRKK